MVPEVASSPNRGIVDVARHCALSAQEPPFTSGRAIKLILTIFCNSSGPFALWVQWGCLMGRWHPSRAANEYGNEMSPRSCGIVSSSHGCRDVTWDCRLTFCSFIFSYEKPHRNRLQEARGPPELQRWLMYYLRNMSKHGAEDRNVVSSNCPQTKLLMLLLLGWSPCRRKHSGWGYKHSFKKARKSRKKPSRIRMAVDDRISLCKSLWSVHYNFRSS